MKLPFNLNPIIKGFQPEAFVLGIVLSENENYLPYILSQYIQVVCYNDYNTYQGVLNFNTGNSNWYLTNHGLLSSCNIVMPNNEIDSQLNFTAISKFLLDRNYYIMGIFNEYDVPGKKYYQTKHRRSDFLLYGYDDTKNGFYSAGYLKNNQYQPFLIDYDIYEKSLYLKEPPRHLIWGLKFNKNIELPFHLELMKKELKQYLNSENTTQSPFLYGLNALKGLADDIIQRQSSIEDLDIFSLMALYEHKKLMVIRIEYLMQKDILHQKDIAFLAEDIFKISGSIMNDADEYQANKSKEILNRIVEKIGRIIQQDEYMLNRLYQLI